MKPITLTTDFGLSDWFVGALKGVILSISPRARVVDLTHGIPQGDVRAGAFALAAACRLFPKGTVHVAVVDPGVGTDRCALAVKTRDYWFLGPDNGLLSLALSRETILSIRRLENPASFLPNVSRTFHGRDVFAPVAAHLNRGADWRRFGPLVTQYQRLEPPPLHRRPRELRGQTVYLDRFGNAITNIPADAIAKLRPAALTVYAAGIRVGPLAASYQAVPPGKPVALIGSCDLLEVALNGGSAARQLRLRPGSPVWLRW